MSQRQANYIHGADPEEQERLRLMNRVMNEPCLARLSIRPGDRILDVGSGLAQMARELAARTGPAGRVIGIERDERQLAAARAREPLGPLPEWLEVRHGDAYHLPLELGEVGSFDLVHSRFLLEHLGDPLAAVKEMARAARPGGKVALFDDDHDIMRFWPEIPRFESVWRMYQRSYDRLGNDPLLGRRQPALLAAAGLVPTGCDWVFFGACHGSERFEPLVKNLAEVVRGSIPSMAKFGLVEPSTVETGLAELAAWSARPGASLWYAIAFAEAEKPAGL